MAKSFLGQTGLPVGIQNNNPGNLVKTAIAWEGKIPHAQNTSSRFEQFINIEYGIRALMRDIITDYSRGLTTVNELINEFAPPHENNTASYVAFVSNAIGISSTAQITLTKEALIAICQAIVIMENGQIARTILSDNDYENAYKILGKTLPTAKSGFGFVLPITVLFLISLFAFK